MKIYQVITIGYDGFGDYASTTLCVGTKDDIINFLQNEKYRDRYFITLWEDGIEKETYESYEQFLNKEGTGYDSKRT